MSQAEAISHAIKLAAEAHSGQYRKGTGIPYIWHPMGVGKLLEDAGCSTQAIVSGILHDVLEDTPVTLSQVRDRFGVEVAEVVQACSESDRNMPWEERKRRVIENLRTAPFEVKMVSAADKVDNLRAIATDLAKLGDEVWTRFNRGREEQEWYYRNVLVSLRQGSREAADHSLLRLLEMEIERVFGDRSGAVAGLVGESERTPGVAGGECE